MRTLDEMFSQLDTIMTELNETRRLRRLARMFGKAGDEVRHSATITDLMTKETRLVAAIRREVTAEARRRDLDMAQAIAEIRLAA